MRRNPQEAWGKFISRKEGVIKTDQ